ncbi:MAG: hypothetical protein M3O33_01255 [Cyanobacteriota bacterium]|nr:hypothetical protein [Cyanobacteriota bacterium]
MKNIKSTLYPVLILLFLLGLGLAALGLGWFRFTVSIESESPDTVSLPVIEPPTPPAPEKVKKLSPVLPIVTPALPPPVASASKNPDPAMVAARQGALRVSNPTEHPVRVALLTRQSAEKTDGQPAHWDFSPMEGGSQGLMLSLPQGNLKLKKGDILVAFAQDGSRLYWGPYVVGETPLPIWNQQKAEWQLILQP